MTYAKMSTRRAKGNGNAGLTCGWSAAATTFALLVVLSGCGSQAAPPSGQNGFAMLAHTQAESAAPGQNSVVLTGLKPAEASVVGGNSTSVTLSLDNASPAGGVEVLLSSSDPAVLVPASVRIAGGERTTTFAVSTVGVDAAVAATISAQYETSTAGANLAVLPPSTAPFSVTVAPSTFTVQQGKSGAATVTTKINTGFNHSLQLKASGEPSGVSLALKPQTIPAPGAGTSALTITVSTRVQTGSYPLTLTASEGTSSASAKATLKVVSGTTNPNATFKGCWYKSGGHRYQGVDVSVGKPGTYPFNAILYHGTTCNPNDFADQFGFGQLIQFGAYGYTFWFTDFSDQTDMSALWYVGDENSQCVNYLTALDC